MVRFLVALWIGIILLRKYNNICTDIYKISWIFGPENIIIACTIYLCFNNFPSCGHEVARDCFHAEANLGKAWMTASITEVHMQYKAFTTKEIVADIRLGIGLRGINVTLIGTSTIVRL